MALNKNLPPPLPPKPERGTLYIPAKPEELMRDIASAKSFPVVPVRIPVSANV